GRVGIFYCERRVHAALSRAGASAVFRQSASARCDVPRPAGGRRYRRHWHARHRSRRGRPLMHDLILYIQSYLDSDKTPGGAGNIFWATVYILLVFGGLSVAVIAMNWLERKILAHMQ